jgi:tRNA pseudouridine32 synthase
MDSEDYDINNYKPKRPAYHSLIKLSGHEQIRQNIYQLVKAMTSTPNYTPIITNDLRKIPPYWYPYTTYAKMRWLNRELLEVVSTEFRDRSMEYYVRNALDFDSFLIYFRDMPWSLA